EDDLSRRRDAIRVLNDVDKLDSIDIAQKARVRWALEGDENTSFFHGREFLERPITTDEIKRAVWDCGGDREFPIGCNPSFIALIPKVANARFVSDFQAISLIGSQYKIVGRNILDGPIIINEVIVCWILGCLRNARSSILINGSPTQEFDIQRGLRQGDPLSPFLFILAIEGLHVLSRKAESLGLFKGVSIGYE
nr:hypothetical protein [Tanacetum cinerariifolium]